VRSAVALGAMPGVRAFDHRYGGELREPPDLALAGLARRQYGVVARRQLVALGLGRRGIDRRRERGRLHLLHRGVYAVGHTSLTQRGRWMAAVLALGPEALLSHRPGGALWRVIGVRGRDCPSRR
jgi:Transcriptional regulator, AbiEi antitoxin